MPSRSTRATKKAHPALAGKSQGMATPLRVVLCFVSLVVVVVLSVMIKLRYLFLYLLSDSAYTKTIKNVFFLVLALYFSVIYPMGVISRCEWRRW